MTSQIPGVAPIIPGIDIPLFAGIISLAVLLVVHEFSHGLLARAAKVRLKSIGLLIFSIIPVGAFVEPDERQISKVKKAAQTKPSLPAYRPISSRCSCSLPSCCRSCI